MISTDEEKYLKEKERGVEANVKFLGELVSLHFSNQWNKETWCNHQLILTSVNPISSLSSILGMVILP
jgi:hypothetical protein